MTKMTAKELVARNVVAYIDFTGQAQGVHAATIVELQLKGWINATESDDGWTDIVATPEGLEAAKEGTVYKGVTALTKLGFTFKQDERQTRNMLRFYNDEGQFAAFVGPAGRTYVIDGKKDVPVREYALAQGVDIGMQKATRTAKPKAEPKPKPAAKDGPWIDGPEDWMSPEQKVRARKDRKNYLARERRKQAA